MKHMKNIHPFPARMAPEIALNSLKALSKEAVVLDPMSGSGTVLRQAVLNGHAAIGFDMDPLAVLMSSVWTQPVCFTILDELYNWLILQARTMPATKIKLPWMDKDQETREFIKYWFATPQKTALRRLAYVLNTSRKIKVHPNEANLLKIAFSKLIITKHRGASLAWDVSHSRPHKVREINDFDVWDGYARTYNQLKSILIDQKITGVSRIHLGDARNMAEVPSHSVDAVITSPPYLNAIDYLRGHKLSLVWLGYTIAQIRTIRGECIGVEKRIANGSLSDRVIDIAGKLRGIDALPGRQVKMIERYASDAYLLMQEIARVLKSDGKAVLVVGNSCLQNVFVENSKIFSEAGKFHDLTLSKKTTRELPVGSRYLPLPKDGSSLSKRMKTEVILEFARR
jgi:hypothetical protein